MDWVRNGRHRFSGAFLHERTPAALPLEASLGENMDFIKATQELISGNRIISDKCENGVPKELVLECGAVFVKVPRSKGAKADNYIFSSPKAEEITSDEWRFA